MIPLFITNAIENRPVPLYGDGLNERDWLHVGDHCRALDLLIDRGVPGEVYNVGGGNHVKNIDLTRRILQLVGRPHSLISPSRIVPDTIAGIRSIAPSCRASAGRPRVPFERGLAETVAWYRDNDSWWRPIKDADPAYRQYYEKQYGATRS